MKTSNNPLTGVVTTILITMICCGCKQPNALEPLSDPMYFVWGLVVDSATTWPIQSVQVGYRSPDWIDSAFFAGDSVRLWFPQGCGQTCFSDTNGAFQLMWFGVLRHRANVQSLYAYRHGYRLWRFDQQPLELTRIDDFRDSITIRLIRDVSEQLVDERLQTRKSNP